ncbi:MAG: DinB family protein [Niastella sp.]|nr:DinB family protein [Niastella sp.]
MIRSALKILPAHFDKYINLCDDVEIPEAIETSMIELKEAPLKEWEALGNMAYAPGKWTIKDILQHLIDTERVFCFRALCFARKDPQQMMGMDEDAYALEACAKNRSIPSLIDDLMISHQSLLSMYKSFTTQMLEQEGQGLNGKYSVADIGFIMPGHQRWHFRTIQERYMPLLG